MAQQDIKRNLLLHPREYDLLQTICTRTEWNEEVAVQELTHLGLEYLQTEGQQIAERTGAEVVDAIRALLQLGKRTPSPRLSEDDVATGALVLGIRSKARELGLQMLVPKKSPMHVLIALPVKRD